MHKAGRAAITISGEQSCVRSLQPDVEQEPKGQVDRSSGRTSQVVDDGSMQQIDSKGRFSGFSAIRVASKVVFSSQRGSNNESCAATVASMARESRAAHRPIALPEEGR